MPAHKLDLRSEVLALLTDQKAAPGDRLYESRIARTLDVSRQPVRNALDQLCQEGLVMVLPQKGYVLQSDLPSDLPYAVGDAGQAVEACYLALVDDHFTQQLPANVTEQEMLRRYEVKPAILNRALSRAATEGWAARKPGNGWLFSEIVRQPGAYDELMHFRAMFEPEALRHIQPHRDAQALQRLRQRQEESVTHQDTMTHMELFRRGAEFHETLMQLSGNTFALDTLKRLNVIRRIFVYRKRLPDPNYINDHVAEHLEILTLLEHNKVSQACDLMRTHLAS
jgi:DNA-binding GntR family transcriptional regulator